MLGSLLVEHMEVTGWPVFLIFTPEAKTIGRPIRWLLKVFTGFYGVLQGFCRVLQAFATHAGV